MHLAFTEEQDELRAAIRSVLAKECAASLPRSIVESTGDADGLWAKMVELDWPALTVPEADGGIGYGFVELAVLAEELGRVIAPGPLFATVTQFVPFVRHSGTPEQRAALLGPAAMQGRWLAEPLGAIFLRLLLSLVLPLAVSALALAVADLQPRALARTGGRLLGLTLGLTSLAVGVGITLVQIFRPGEGIDRTTLPAGGAIAPATSDGIQAIIEIFPSNPFKAAADGNMVPILVFAVVAGLALRQTETAPARRLVEVLQGVFDVCARGVQMVMVMAPVGVGAMAYMAVAKGGLAALLPVGRFALVAASALAIQGVVVYPLALRLLARASPVAFFRAVRPALAVAFATASSAATLPTTLKVADQGLRIPDDTARFVLTVGASANQNGTALYEGVAILFICQLYGVDLTLGQQAIVVGVSVLAGVGTAGVPAASIPVIAAVVGAFGIPPEAVGVLVGVDRLLDMCRTTVNVAGDLVIARIVGGERPEQAEPPPVAS